MKRPPGPWRPPVGVDAYYAGVLPEDKANFIRREHDAGRKVIMLGDGVNDSPALSEADAGIAISDGAAIAREVADITLSGEDLYALLTLKRLSDALMGRIHGNYRKIIGFNLMLICLGVARCAAARDVCPAAQRLHAGHQFGKHASPARGIKTGHPHFWSLIRRFGVDKAPFFRL